MVVDLLEPSGTESPRRRMASLATIALLSLTVVAAEPAPAPGSGAVEPPCGIHVMELVGPVCPAGDGVWEIFDSTGRSLGFTHGPDPAPESDTAALPEGNGTAYTER